MMEFLNRNQLEQMVKSVNLSIEKSRKIELDTIDGNKIHINHDNSLIRENDVYRTFYVVLRQTNSKKYVFRTRRFKQSHRKTKKTKY